MNPELLTQLLMDATRTKRDPSSLDLPLDSRAFLQKYDSVHRGQLLRGAGFEQSWVGQRLLLDAAPELAFPPWLVLSLGAAGGNGPAVCAV